MPRTAVALAVAILAGVLPAAARAQPTRRIPPEVAKLYETKPVIELITMGVGSLIWERHGHIALCVRYDNPRDDRCYNYGIGDFFHPAAMAWGFLRANGAFWVGKSGIEDLNRYVDADRTVWAQPLPLTAAQKQKIIAKLEDDILPEHRAYAYDHFWDNCTTRVRDILDDATDHALSKMPEIQDDRTYRDLAREGFYGMRVPLLVTDIAMGRLTDRVPTYWERMFLPQYLREAVSTLWHIEPIVLYERRGEPPPTDSPSGRVLFALVILVLTAPAWITRLLGLGGIWPRFGLAFAVVPYALLGAALVFVAVISPLPYLRWNEICLVWLPLDLIVVFLGAERRRRYARGRLVMLAAIAALSVVGVLKQPLLAPLLWPAIPLAVAGLWPGKPGRIGEAGVTTAAPGKLP